MATEWTGWAYAEIVIAAKATWGEGWSLGAGPLAGVNVAIYSAWCEALVTFGQADTGLDPDDPAGQTTAFNQYWGHWALYKVGMVLAPGSAASRTIFIPKGSGASVLVLRYSPLARSTATRYARLGVGYVSRNIPSSS